MLSARSVLLAGSSSGAIGALNHVQWIEQHINMRQQEQRQHTNSSTDADAGAATAGVRVRVIADSGFFVDYQQMLEPIARDVSGQQRTVNVSLTVVAADHWCVCG